MLSSPLFLKPKLTNTASPDMVANEHVCMSQGNRICLQHFQHSHAVPVEILRAPSPS